MISKLPTQKYKIGTDNDNPISNFMDELRYFHQD